ncbi:MAG: SUMF1/EgtB/PvdO family nonheme iron enzyme [bacterium]|nr:SUMF1/EgtB/PvdO family nonheme iron enzyme [bacterium]
MKQRASFAWLLVSAVIGTGAMEVASPRLALGEAPIVTNVVAEQLPGTGMVRVTFDVSDAEGDQVTARLTASSNGGSSFDLLATSVSGDVMTPMSPGLGKQIIWNAAADYPGRYWGQVVAKIICSDGALTAGEMVLVPAGPFTMGSNSGSSAEQPEHTVTLDAYYIDKYEVTNAEYQQFIDAGGYSTAAFWSTSGWAACSSGNWTKPYYYPSNDYHTGPAFPGYPVLSITYYEAEAYATFVGKRLPTEAEWEKAARGTDGRTYPWGASVDVGRANYASSGDPFEIGNYSYSSPVGFYDGRLHPFPPFQTVNSPSPFGTYDQAGNAGEWVRDWYSSTYYASSPSVNPEGPAEGTYPFYRVVRGGSYVSGPNSIKTYQRSVMRPGAPREDTPYNYIWIGFRCVSPVR